MDANPRREGQPAQAGDDQADPEQDRRRDARRPERLRCQARPPKKGALDEARRSPARTIETAISSTKPTTDQQLTAIAQAIQALAPIFRGVLMRTEAAAARLARPCAFVVNLADPPGTHWVAIYAPPRGAARWIDSFGLPPPADLLQHLLRLYGGLVYENVGRQPLSSMSCGHRAVLALARAAAGRSTPLPASDDAVKRELLRLASA